MMQARRESNATYEFPSKVFQSNGRELRDDNIVQP
jgi:hypothetical protein